MKHRQPDRPYRRHGLLFRIIDDESVVLDPQADIIHTLNPTATVVWDLLDGEHGVDDLAQAMCTQFDVRLDQAHQDVVALLEQFRRLNLLEQPPA